MSVEGLLTKGAKKIGMDGAIAYSSGSRIFQAFAGVFTVVFIAAFLSKEEQGYYYTFNSLLAIQTFFELGFTTIITQFVAHEVSYLKIDSNSIQGDDYYCSRIGDLLRFSMKWYSIAAIIFLCVVIFVGLFFFYNSNDSISWRGPWIIICIATAIKLFQSPITAILIGVGKVKEMNKILFYQQIVTPIIMWTLLATNCKLYVLGISSFISIAVWFYFILKKDVRELLGGIYDYKVSHKISYVNEIMPYQWRMALSSISGYFIFYFLTPIIFKYQGAVIAGQVGMTISIVSAIQSLSLSWQNTKIPIYSGLIEQKRYKELDNIFNKTVRQMSLICLTIMVAAFFVLTGIKFWGISLNGDYLCNRFLTGWSLLFMFAAHYIDQFVFSWATYLRCHMKEPFLLLSIVSGILCLVGLLLTSKYSNVFYITLSYLLVKFISIPWGYSIYNSKKKEWHGIL